MANSRQPKPSRVPPALQPLVRPFRKSFNRIRDVIGFPLWLISQYLRHRKKIVIISRLGALGDIICTLPLCEEIRKRHPGTLLVFVVMRDYKKMMALASVVDEIYAAKSWIWPFSLPSYYKIPGIVQAIYNPKTTDERLPKDGAQTHLVDDLAESCGLTIPASQRQPRLSVTPELIKKAQSKYGIAADVANGRSVIGINCGRSWPVRMWDAGKWQALVDKIHADYNAVILQFGLTLGDQDEYEHLRGVKLLSNYLQSDELVALIAGCNLIISIDSGPIHVAGAVGVPVVGLFGAVNPKYRLPPDSRASGVFSNVPCLFCHHAKPKTHWQTGCPFDIRCMKELGVQTVFDAVKSMLPNES